MPRKRFKMLMFLALVVSFSNNMINGQVKQTRKVKEQQQVIHNTPIKLITINDLKRVQSNQNIPAPMDIKVIEKEIPKTEIKPTPIPKKAIHFNPYNLNEPSNLTIEELHKMLKDTGIEDVAESILKAEREYNVNAIFLSSLIALESGWGNSKRAKTTNNMGGVAVYSKMSRGAVYNTRGSSVLHIAEFLREDYLAKEGQYYKGVSIWNVNVKYCESKDWAEKIIGIASRLKGKLK